MNKIILILFIITTKFLSTNYYLDSEKGHDANSGISHNSPWKTITKINESRFEPGDSILFKRGLEWRGELVVPSSGTEDNPIVIGAYGKGKNPIIKGSEIANNWTKVSNVIWSTTFNKEPSCIWLINESGNIQWGSKEKTQNKLNRNFEFCWNDSILYLYLDQNMLNKYPQIECSVRDFGIISGWYQDGKDYILIENLEIMFTINSNIRAVGTIGWTVKNCSSHHSGKTDESDGQGIQYEGEDGTFSNNILFENGQHGIYISAFGNSKVNNIIIEKNRVYNNYHTGIDIMNLGGGKDGLKNITIRYNTVFDSQDHLGKEIGIQLLAYPPGKIVKSKIYYNIVYNVKGIAFAIFPEVDSIEILNNTAYEPESACFLLGGDSANILCMNNLGIGNNYYHIISIENVKNKKIDNNLWYRKSGVVALVGSMEYENWQNYTGTTGFDKQSLNSDPMFVNAYNFNFRLKQTSSCINQGAEVGLRNDIFENLIKGKPDIGAVELIE